MGNLISEFRKQRLFVSNMSLDDSSARISGFLDWLDSNDATAAILAEIEDDEKVKKILAETNHQNAPQVSTPDDVVRIGLYFMRQVKAGEILWNLATVHGITPPFRTTSVKEYENEMARRYIEPTFDYIEDKITERSDFQPNAALIEKPIIFSGNFQGAILNINSQLTKSSQIVRNNPDADESAKEELVRLLEELKQALSEASLQKEEEADAVAWAAEALIEAKTSDKPNNVKIEITKENLLKAAKNLAVAMPIVVSIAERIIAIIDKF